MVFSQSYSDVGHTETGPTPGSQVVEIAVAAPGKFRLLRTTAAIDPGRVSNPSLVEAQMMEGGTIFGLSIALFGEITLKEGGGEQGPPSIVAALASALLAHTGREWLA